MLAHTRELRERQRSELGQVRDMLAEVTGQLSRDEALVEKLRSEIAELAPGAQAAQTAEAGRAAEHEAAEEAQRQWQDRWEAFNRELRALAAPTRYKGSFVVSSHR